jgi:hypothetical protein
LSSGELLGYSSGLWRSTLLLHLGHAGCTFGFHPGKLSLAVWLSGYGSLRPVNLNFRVTNVTDIACPLGTDTNTRDIYKIAGSFLTASCNNMSWNYRECSRCRTDSPNKLTS